MQLQFAAKETPDVDKRNAELIIFLDATRICPYSTLC